MNLWWLPRLKLNLTLLYSYPLMNILPNVYLVPSLLETLPQYPSLESIAGSRLVSFVLANIIFEAFAKTLSHNEKTLLWRISENSSFVLCDRICVFNSNHCNRLRVPLPRWYLMIDIDRWMKNYLIRTMLMSRRVFIGFYRILLDLEVICWLSSHVATSRN